MLVSPIHHASLVHPSTHSPALLQLIDLKMSRAIIEYIVDCVVDTVDFAMGRPSSSRTRPLSKRPEHAKFTTFVNNIITRAEVATPTILASLVYIDRAKPHLHIALEEWALERVFLGAVIVASKYLNDSTLKNVHWALCTGVFGKRDVGRIEREFLDVLDFELSITEDDLLSHHDTLTAVALPIPSHRPSRSFIQARARRSRTTTTTTPHHPQQQLPVPELDPSSPESSSSPGSDSPRTPSTLSASPSYTSPRSSSQSSQSSSSSSLQKDQTQPQFTAAPGSFQSGIKTLEILNSFPIIPMPTASSQHQQQQGSHSHVKLPSSQHAQRSMQLRAF